MATNLDYDESNEDVQEFGNQVVSALEEIESLIDELKIDDEGNVKVPENKTDAESQLISFAYAIRRAMKKVKAIQSHTKLHVQVIKGHANAKVSNLENSINFLTEHCLHLLDYLSLDKYQVETVGTFGSQKNPDSLDSSQFDSLTSKEQLDIALNSVSTGNKLFRISIIPDANEIKKLLKEGTEVPGFEMKEGERVFKFRLRG